MRPSNVSRLSRLIASGEHDQENAPATCEIQSIARVKVDPHLGHLAAYRLPVAKIARLRETKSGSDAYLRSLVPKGVKPVLELLRLPNSKRTISVSDRILLSMLARRIL